MSNNFKEIENKEMKVWAKANGDKISYSTSISNKDANGKWENYYISVVFPKGTAIDNGEVVKVTSGFWSFWKDKNGLPHPKIVVMSYEDNGINITNEKDDMPF